MAVNDRLVAQFRAAGRSMTWLLRALLVLSKVRTFDAVPLVGTAIGGVRGLAAGHATEDELNVPAEFAARRASFSAQTGVPSTADVVIIGSGPGAAMAAIELSRRGREVLVLERGRTSSTPNRFQHSLAHVRSDFVAGGQEAALALPPVIFSQAQVLGGGSEVNSGLYHRTPDQVAETYRRAWSLELSEWLQAQEQVESVLDCKTQDLKPDNSVVATGASALGLPYALIPRWRTYSDDGSYIQHGMLRQVWTPLVAAGGVTTVESCNVATVQEQFGRLTVSGTCESQSFKVYANQVIVAGGPVSTPTLLARSELIDWKQARFQWHPMIRCIAQCPPETLGYGDVDPYQAWLPDRTIKFGSAVSTPGMLAVSLQRQVTPEESPRLRSYYASVVSSGRGGLVPGIGRPWYQYSGGDRNVLRRASLALTELLTTSGQVDRLLLSSSKPSTVHIFGSLPPESHVYLHGTSQLRRNPRVSIADSSLLPVGPGVNPQGPAMVLARALAARVARNA